MCKNVWPGLMVFVVCGAVAGAQSSNPTPQPSSQTPAAGSPQTPTSAQPPSQSPGTKITLQGCLERNAQTSNSPAGTSGRTGSTAGATDTGGSAVEQFVLASSTMAAGTSGMSGATSPNRSATAVAPRYRLDAEASKLSPHVNHKVEITGTVDTASAAASPSTGSMPAPTTADRSTPPAGGQGASTATAQGASTNMPRLRVDNIKMIAASCTP
jgi:hypothetical protein